MSQKGFANIVVIALAVAILLGIAGYFVLVRRPATLTEVGIPSFPAKLDVSGAPSGPLDQALAEITVLSQAGEELKISIDKIRDYIRYPAATNPQLKAGDTVSIRFNGWLDTFQSSEKACPAGYIKSPKPGQVVPIGTPDSRTVPRIAAGDRYLSKLYGCFAEIGGFTCPNEKSGWSGWLYNNLPKAVEYECVKAGTSSSEDYPAKIPHRKVAYQVNSGVHNNPSDKSIVAFREVIRVPGVPWLQLHFQEYNLGAASRDSKDGAPTRSYIEVTSLKDGARETLNAASLSQQQSSTAYFNGDAVEIKLHVAPQDSGIFLRIEEITVGKYGI